MVGAIRNSFSYIVASPFMALWRKFGDKMGNQGRSLAEVESPYCIFGCAFILCQACVLAHVLRQGFDQGVAPGGSFQPPEVLHELGKRTTYPFVRDRVIFTGGSGGEENIAGGRYTRPQAVINVSKLHKL
jgi:hypothetical protein